MSKNRHLTHVTIVTRPGVPSGPTPPHRRRPEPVQRFQKRRTDRTTTRFPIFIRLPEVQTNTSVPPSPSRTVWTIHCGLVSVPRVRGRRRRRRYRSRSHPGHLRRRVGTGRHWRNRDEVPVPITSHEWKL